MSSTAPIADPASSPARGPDVDPSSRGPRSRADEGPRRWLAPALGAAGLLVLPAVAWLAFPASSRVAPSTRAAVVEAAPMATATPASPRGQAPAPRPRATAARAPTPAAAASEDAGAPVTGVVLGAKDAPVSDATVGCDDGRDVDRVDTDAEGRFRLGPDAAGCRAVARHPRFGRSTPVVLSATGDNVLHLATASGTIEGVVVDEGGKPVSSYFLYVESFDATSERKELDHQRFVEDPKGAFSWSGLPPGKYVLLASSDGRAPTRSSPVEVTEDKTTKDVKIVASAGAKLEGVVVDAQTKSPIAGASIGLFMTGPYGIVLRAPVVSGADGSFTMTGMPSGSFPIKATAKGYEAKTFGDTTAGAGRQTFALTREASN